MYSKLLSTSLLLPAPKSSRYISVDIVAQPDGKKKPVIVFVHGFKGFKDWGPFNLMARYFAEHDFVFIKFNFSHNGTTPFRPEEFVDLEAFGNDNHSRQLDELGVLIDRISDRTKPLLDLELNRDKIYLVGHSRGGSMVLLKAAEDARVQKVVTWAAVSDLLSSYSEDDVKDWSRTGVSWIPNARTGQQMPVYYQYYEDLVENQERLNVLQASAKINQPFLILHGEKDETVSPVSANAIYQQTRNSKLEIIAEANHTFGGTHPFAKDELPVQFKELCDKTVLFLKHDL